MLTRNYILFPFLLFWKREHCLRWKLQAIKLCLQHKMFLMRFLHEITRLANFLIWNRHSDWDFYCLQNRKKFQPSAISLINALQFSTEASLSLFFSNKFLAIMETKFFTAHKIFPLDTTHLTSRRSIKGIERARRVQGMVKRE
jgi:hypothetical protein